ncbi:hypothetical protein L6V77_10550 [Myxococcota bacterium]|nr:hypothetical protein [Myxococcota bacterium]
MEPGPGADGAVALARGVLDGAGDDDATEGGGPCAVDRIILAEEASDPAVLLEPAKAAPHRAAVSRLPIALRVVQVLRQNPCATTRTTLKRRS